MQPSDTTRELLLAQLDIPWSLADRFVLPNLGEEASHWRPSANVCAVRASSDGRCSVDFPDETATPLPDATAAWVLWHITWWWTNAERWSQDRASLPPSSVPWPGTVADAVGHIRQLHQRWTRLLSEHPLSAVTSAPFPMGHTFEGLACWANIEFTKNIAEVGQLMRLHLNSRQGPAHGPLDQRLDS